MEVLGIADEVDLRVDHRRVQLERGVASRIWVKRAPEQTPPLDCRS